MQYSIKRNEEEIVWWEEVLRRPPVPDAAKAKSIRTLIELLRGQVEEFKQDEREIAADLGISLLPLAPMPHEKKRKD